MINVTVKAVKFANVVIRFHISKMISLLKISRLAPKYAGIISSTQQINGRNKGAPARPGRLGAPSPCPGSGPEDWIARPSVTSSPSSC